MRKMREKTWDDFVYGCKLSRKLRSIFHPTCTMCYAERRPNCLGCFRCFIRHYTFPNSCTSSVIRIVKTLLAAACLPVLQRLNAGGLTYWWRGREVQGWAGKKADGQTCNISLIAMMTAVAENPCMPSQ